MVSPPRTAAGAAAVLALLALGVAFSQQPPSPTPNPPAGGERPAQVIGMAGCAATGCHGRPDVSTGQMPADVWHESFSRWIDRDPHTRAYDVLESPLGKQIMKNLRQGDASLKESATEDARCIACHANPSLATKDAMDDPRLNRLRAEGVSCEACHGNAERWQIAHTNWTNKETRAADFHNAGMNDLNDWSIQAKTCVGCHVGAKAENGNPVRDMNHDMIAAGHPRLEFEFVTFHQKLSKHWLPKHRGSATTDLGKQSMLQAWLVGQIVTEEAYCELSLDRIARGTAGEPRSPFPEFADWNCSQCHHNLVPAEWRANAAQARATAGRPLGRPAWIGESAALPSLPAPQFALKAKEIEAQKQKLLDRQKARREMLTAVTTNPKAGLQPKLLELLRVEPAKVLNWEEATRTYAALKALEVASRESGANLTKDAGSLLADFQMALWGQNREPGRREFLDKSNPGYKGYQRKPESRWQWEKPDHPRKEVEDTATGLRKALAERLKTLPPQP